jgi:uncharacterized membrane protein YvbJ
MITCPNCGSENRYGAIFCRGCGKKLDVIDEITVENIGEKTTGKKRRRRKDKGERTPKELRKRGMVINAVRILIILLVAFGVYLTQQTPPVSAIETSDASKKSFDRKREHLLESVRSNKPDSETITQKELNSHIASLLPSVKQGKVVKLENLQIALGSGEEDLSVQMYVRVFGKRMLFQLFGNLEKEKGEIVFSSSTFAKVGKLPYPAFLMKMHCKNVFSDLREKDASLLEKITRATVENVKIKGGGQSSAIKVQIAGK